MPECAYCTGYYINLVSHQRNCEIKRSVNQEKQNEAIADQTQKTIQMMEENKINLIQAKDEIIALLQKQLETQKNSFDNQLLLKDNEIKMLQNYIFQLKGPNVTINMTVNYMTKVNQYNELEHGIKNFMGLPQIKELINSGLPGLKQILSTLKQQILQNFASDGPKILEDIIEGSFLPLEGSSEQVKTLNDNIEKSLSNAINIINETVDDCVPQELKYELDRMNKSLFTLID